MRNIFLLFVFTSRLLFADGLFDKAKEAFMKAELFSVDKVSVGKSTYKGSCVSTLSPGTITKNELEFDRTDEHDPVFHGAVVIQFAKFEHEPSSSVLEKADGDGNKYGNMTRYWENSTDVTYGTWSAYEVRLNSSEKYWAIFGRTPLCELWNYTQGYCVEWQTWESYCWFPF
jgi:hypothetical protein